MAWFGRKLTTASPEAKLTFEELVSGWRAILKQEIPNHPLDSDRPFPYYELNNTKKSRLFAIFYNFSFMNRTKLFHQTFKKKAFSIFLSETISKVGLSDVI